MTGAHLPTPDADSEAFWAGLQRGVLLYQRCRHCDHAQLYFRAMCRACWSRQVEAAEASGAGEIYSFTIVHQTLPALAQETPFTLALIALDEGPRLLARLDHGARAPVIGQRARFSPRTVNGFNLAHFTLTEDAP